MGRTERCDLMDWCRIFGFEPKCWRCKVGTCPLMSGGMDVGDDQGRRGYGGSAVVPFGSK